ncbi:MAG: hypothetical protein CO093_09695 [Alphaproteobacteria bacterium CG_4_9_14_3_um_filter_47_13]|nr:MAG: hypothetical protein CO093_09695 [Alphaproteobacteria bacterium CG_4_9_14_3_um_filter_47_13]
MGFFDFFKRKTPHLTVRFSEAADQKRVLDFYKNNKNKFVDLRKEEIWNERTRNGRIIIAEDHNKNIGFMAAAYDFEQDGQIKWIEVGSILREQNPDKDSYKMIKGITLYPYMIASLVINEFLNHTPEDKIIANVYDNNPGGIYLMNTKTGWGFFEPEHEILVACKATKDNAGHHATATRLWLTATTDTLPFQARLVLQMIDNDSTTGLFNRISQKHVPIEISRFSLANEFYNAVQTLAKGSFARELENNPHMGMKPARDMLEKHMKSPLQSSQFLRKHP